jgi:hypothetical protein
MDKPRGSPIPIRKGACKLSGGGFLPKRLMMRCKINPLVALNIRL